MTLLKFLCPFELSYQAFITCLSIALGVPVPHERLLQGSPGHEHIDVWADRLLHDPRHAARSRKASHDHLAFCLSDLAPRAGLSSSALQSAVPVAEEDNRRVDTVTSVAGLSARSATYRFSSQTLLITDFTMIHHFSGDHVFMADSLTTAETLKNNLYQPDYNQLGMDFAPLVCNSFGQQGPDLFTYSRHQCSTLCFRVSSTLSLPASATWPAGSCAVLRALLRQRRSTHTRAAAETLAAGRACCTLSLRRSDARADGHLVPLQIM